MNKACFEADLQRVFLIFTTARSDPRQARRSRQPFSWANSLVGNLNSSESAVDESQGRSPYWGSRPDAATAG